MAYHRGHPRDYDDWVRAGNTGWSFDAVLPYFLKSENNVDLRDSAVHGTEGPVHVASIPRPNRLNQAFLDAFASLGSFKPCSDFAGLDPEGYGLRQGTIHRGRRDSTATAYLAPAQRRANLTVLTRQTVSRVLVENGRAVGVEMVHGETLQRAQASREVLLCAGTIHSPQLLLLSGIGNAAALRALDIPVVGNLPGVGANYHDHPALALTMEMHNSTSYGLSWRALPRNIASVAEYLLDRSGPLASNVFESTAFVRSQEPLDRPDIQIAFQPARRNPDLFPLPRGHGYAMSVVNLYPRSRGTVTLANKDPRTPPRVDAGLFTDPVDMTPILRGMRIVRQLCAAAPLARYQAREALPGPGVRSDAEFIAYLRRGGGGAPHPRAPCRMGTDAKAVVDTALRVHGVAGLRVVDGSIFPSIVGGNTNAPIVMVAERAASLILGRD
jgi:choline dehydrogenase-like flavoprotein